MTGSLRHAGAIAVLVWLTGVFTAGTALGQDNPLAALQDKQTKIFEEVAPAVVFITHEKGFGSGFFVSSDGAILTNAHVVGNRKKVSVVLRDGRKTTGTVVGRAARKYDLALVRVPLKKTPSVPLAGMSDVRVGNWVASVGHGEGGIWTYTTGMISNIYPSGTERPVFQTQIPLNPGNSGGPIVDIEGRAIGVVTAGIDGANNINFAIPTEIGLKHLDALSKHCDCLVIRAPKRQPIFVNGVMVGKGPRVVLPAERKQYKVMVLIDGKPRQLELTWPKTRQVDLTKTEQKKANKEKK